MKKFILLSLFSVLIMTGCSTSAEEGDTSKIGLGMSKEEVVSYLGEPDYRTTDREKLSNEYESLSMLHAVDSEFSDDKDENIIYERLGTISNAIEEQRNVEIFDYEVTEDYNILVYFIDNEVAHFYELDLSV